MKILYACFFFLNMLVIGGLGYTLFRGMDNGVAAWEDVALAFALGLSIAVMVLLIRHYMGSGDSEPNDN